MALGLLSCFLSLYSAVPAACYAVDAVSAIDAGMVLHSSLRETN